MITKAYAIKEKIILKDIIKKVKRKPTEWEKLFVNHKGLHSIQNI